MNSAGPIRLAIAVKAVGLTRSGGTSVLADGVDRILDHRALLRLVHAHQVAGVVGAVGIELPVLLHAGLDDLWMVFAHRDVE